MAARYETDLAHRDKLRAVHLARLTAHWGAKYAEQAPWPQTDKDWRQTSYGAPWDSNVYMAEWHLKLATKLKQEGLLDG